MKKGKISLELIVFSIGFCLLWGVFTDVFQPKYLFASTYVSPETEMWTDFYRQDKNSLDVIYVGSSHVYNDINPIVIYEETGLTGFNMATSAQDMATAYFLLKEALRFQSPKCVILDVYGFHFQSLLLTENYKKTLDNMRWSKVKQEAMEAWQKNLEQEKTINRIFTLIDFHTRWGELNDNDFNYRDKMQLYKGYSPCTEVQPVELLPLDGYPAMNLNDIDVAYLDSIIDLCDEEEIQLVLISTPHGDWRPEEKEMITELAGQRGIAFYDFNEPSQVEAAGLDLQRDFKDRNHLNVFGAQKFSKHIADYVLEWGNYDSAYSEKVDEYWSECVSDWNDTFAAMQGILQNGE